MTKGSGDVATPFLNWIQLSVTQAEDAVAHVEHPFVVRDDDDPFVAFMSRLGRRSMTRRPFG